MESSLLRLKEYKTINPEFIDIITSKNDNEKTINLLKKTIDELLTIKQCKISQDDKTVKNISDAINLISNTMNIPNDIANIICYYVYDDCYDCKKMFGCYEFIKPNYIIFSLTGISIINPITNIKEHTIELPDFNYNAYDHDFKKVSCRINDDTFLLYMIVTDRKSKEILTSSLFTLNINVNKIERLDLEQFTLLGYYKYSRKLDVVYIHHHNNYLYLCNEENKNVIIRRLNMKTNKIIGEKIISKTHHNKIWSFIEDELYETKKCVNLSFKNVKVVECEIKQYNINNDSCQTITFSLDINKLLKYNKKIKQKNLNVYNFYVIVMNKNELFIIYYFRYTNKVKYVICIYDFNTHKYTKSMFVKGEIYISSYTSNYVNISYDNKNDIYFVKTNNIATYKLIPGIEEFP